MQRLEEIQCIARKATEHYLKKLPWASSHVSDMMQEAVIAVMGADGFNPDAGTPWEAYAMCAALKAVKRYLHYNRAAVVSPRPERGGKPLEMISLTPNGSGDAYDRLVYTLASPSALPSDLIDHARTQARVRAIVRRLDDSKGKLATRVLLDEKTPAEVRKKGMRMKVVRYAVKNTTRRAGRDHALLSLARELYT